MPQLTNFPPLLTTGKSFSHEEKWEKGPLVRIPWLANFDLLESNSIYIFAHENQKLLPWWINTLLMHFQHPCGIQPKKQFKVQIIGTLEKIDSFYWPKIHLWKCGKKFGRCPSFLIWIKSKRAAADRLFKVTQRTITISHDGIVWTKVVMQNVDEMNDDKSIKRNVEPWLCCFCNS